MPGLLARKLRPPPLRETRTPVSLEQQAEVTGEPRQEWRSLFSLPASLVTAGSLGLTLLSSGTFSGTQHLQHRVCLQLSIHTVSTSRGPSPFSTKASVDEL